MSDKIQFAASLPPIQSALKISGDGDNLRVQFDIPLRTTPDGAKLILFSGKRLLVTVEDWPDPLTDLDGAGKKGDNETQESTEGSGSKVGRRRIAKRRDQSAGG